MDLPAAARAAVYQLAARMVLREPDQALLATLREPNVLAVLDRVAPGVADDLSDWTPERAEEADVAFTGLFLLPNGVATRAEAWLGPGGGRPLRSSVAQALQALGREVTQEQGRLPLDHASLLFDLAAHLLREMPPDELLAADLLDPWTRRFAEALSAAEAPRLYVALGHLLATLHPSTPERGAQPS